LPKAVAAAARLRAINPRIVRGMDVVVDGTALVGGKGSVIMTFPGVLIVLAIQRGLSVVQVDPYWQRIACGTLVLFAVFINTDRIGKSVVIK